MGQQKPNGARSPRVLISLLLAIALLAAIVPLPTSIATAQPADAEVELRRPLVRVRDQRPDFWWSSVDGADEYRLVVNRLGDSAETAIVDRLVTAADVRCETRLVCRLSSRVRFRDAGEWWVTAYLADGSVITSDRSVFYRRGHEPTPTPPTTWSPLSAVTIVDPRDFGAAGDGAADDTNAMRAAVAALSTDGGVIYVDPALEYRLTDTVMIEADHIKIWSPGGGMIFQQINGQRGRQALQCFNADACGFFGLHLHSDADERFDGLDDHQLSIVFSPNSEVVGNEIEGGAATGMFFYGSDDAIVHGNYVHHTWADSIHFTNGSRRAWVWDNTMFNEAPSLGDDAIACVTYKPEPLCGDMEWWDNEHLGGAWGRGFAVVGGEDIWIHDNTTQGSGGAGIYMATEPFFDTARTRDILITDNVVCGAGTTIDQPGILLSGLNNDAPVSRITLRDNVVAESVLNEDFREEGDVRDTVNTGLVTGGACPLSPADPSTAAPIDTSVLRTFDTTFAGEGFRSGLYRVHLRVGATGFEQRFEYLVVGPDAAVDDLIDQVWGVGVLYRSSDGIESVVAVHSPYPLIVSPLLTGVQFVELRDAVATGGFTDLWNLLHITPPND